VPVLLYLLRNKLDDIVVEEKGFAFEEFAEQRFQFETSINKGI
jgi:hypothetical protein